MRKQAFISVLACGIAMTIGACAYDDYYYGQPYGGYSYQGQQWSQPQQPREYQPYTGDLSGPGVGVLDPWLRETAEGRLIVTMGWRDAGTGVVSEELANRANVWFRRYADHDSDMRITDSEIRTALVYVAGRYSRPAG